MDSETDYWSKQTIDNPLFPELIWSRPENKATSGKLLIIGGNIHGFASVVVAYNIAKQSGVGEVRVILPDSLKSSVGIAFDQCEFTPSTPSGSFSQSALATLIDLSEWTDGILITGDLGRNSETLILIENFLNTYKGQMTLTNDIIESYTKSPDLLISRTKTTLVMDFNQLQQIYKNSSQDTPITSHTGMVQLVKSLHDFTLRNPINIVVKFTDTIFVCTNGFISTTRHIPRQTSWQTYTASKAAVWWLQNPNKPFEAISTSICTD